jgi:NTE family protein
MLSWTIVEGYMHGLVLSGGGRKGAFQVGVLDVLAVRGARWEFLAGTSVGAINTSYLAAFPASATVEGVEGLKRLWGQLDTRGVWKHWLLGPASGIWKSSFFNASPLHRLLRRELNEGAVRNSGRQLRLGIVQYGTGEYFEATEKSTPLWQYVAASSSYPGGLNPVELPEGMCGDGGVVSATPLKGAIDAGCTKIDVVITDPLSAHPWRDQDSGNGTRVSALTIVMRSVALLMHTAMVADVRRAMQVNQDVAEGRDAHHRMIELAVYAPDRPLSSGPLGSLDFNPEETQRLIAYGREVAESRSHS